jgi:SAM-dependent methyltransferase
MGSQAIQGPLWGRQAEDWASIQEETGRPGYEHALKFLKLSGSNTLLDAGCGSGLFSTLAASAGAAVTGLDASEPLIARARKRNPAGHYIVGEIEELPFADNSFSVVVGFNSFQYAASIQNALTEARRVLKDKGRLVVMIWGNREDCEAATYLNALGSLLPPPPPRATGPFSLSENRLLEKTMESTGFRIIDQSDVVSVWDYPDADTTLKGLMSAGPAVRTVEQAGFEKVQETIKLAIQPYIHPDGHVIFHNKFRIVIAEKSSR